MFNIFNNDSNKGQRLSSSSISLDDSKVKSNNDDIMIQGLVELKGTMHRALSSYEFGSPVVTSLVAIKDNSDNNDDNYYLSCGKLRIPLLADMDISPKCFSIMTNNDDDEPGVITIRTKDSNKILYLRLPDSNTFSQWQIMLGDAIANAISIDAIKLQPTGRVSSSKIISALTTCNLLTSTNNPAIIRLRTALRMRHLMSEIIQRLNLSPHLVAQNEVQGLILEANNHVVLRNDVDLSFLKTINERIYDKEALAAISYEIQMEETNDPITYGWTAASIAAIEDKDTNIINELSEKERILNAELSDITAAFATISEKAVDVEMPIISTETLESPVDNNSDTNINTTTTNNDAKEYSQENNEPKNVVPTVIASLSPFSASSSRFLASPFNNTAIVEIDDRHVTPISMNPSTDDSINNSNGMSLPAPLLPALRDSNKPKAVSEKSVTFELDKENTTEKIKEVPIPKENSKVRRPLANITNSIDSFDNMKSKKKSPISAPTHAKRKIIASPIHTSNNDNITQQLSLSEPVSSTNVTGLIQFYQEKTNANKAETIILPPTKINSNIDNLTIETTNDDSIKEKYHSNEKIIAANNKVIYLAAFIAMLSIVIASFSLSYTFSVPRTKSIDEALYFTDGKLDLEKIHFTKKIYDSMPVNVPKDIRQESAILATLKTYDSNVPIQKKETVDKG